MYKLQKYKGRSSRHTCPSCNRSHCFTLYVDDYGAPLHESVGRCDHSSSCGYHYTPQQYFIDHPGIKTRNDWRDLNWAQVTKFATIPKTNPICLIPEQIVERSIRYDHDSDLVSFMKTIIDPMVVEGLIDDYRIGVTRSNDTIFFQIDTLGCCRTGKIMKYDSETGHRIKDQEVPGRITWVHSLMKQSGDLPREWQLTQCLFGEHLLSKYPKKHVGLVESEKTAIICAGLMPEYLWVATGGKSCINDRILVLKGRKVVAFPDIDGYQEWVDKLAKYPEIDITVSSILQRIATTEDHDSNIDIADLIIRFIKQQKEELVIKENNTFRRVVKFFDVDYHQELEAIIEDFGLEVDKVGLLSTITNENH